MSMSMSTRVNFVNLKESVLIRNVFPSCSEGQGVLK